MRRWLPLLLLSLFVHDVTIDALDADCAAEETCCACVCQTHAASPAAAGTIAAPAAASNRSLPGRTLFTAHLSDKSLFHPPKALA